MQPPVDNVFETARPFGFDVSLGSCVRARVYGLVCTGSCVRARVYGLVCTGSCVRARVYGLVCTRVLLCWKCSYCFVLYAGSFILPRSVYVTRHLTLIMKQGRRSSESQRLMQVISPFLCHTGLSSWNVFDSPKLYHRFRDRGNAVNRSKLKSKHQIVSISAMLPTATETQIDCHQCKQHYIKLVIILLFSICHNRRISLKTTMNTTSSIGVLFLVRLRQIRHK